MTDDELLGLIAFKWRGCTHKEPRKSEIAAIFKEDYARAVDRLIKSGQWTEVPPPEDQLPCDMMPKAFFEYWKIND